MKSTYLLSAWLMEKITICRNGVIIILLLLLARKRGEDTNKDVTDSECGWVGIAELSDWLRVEEAHLNIQIYRARKQFSQQLKTYENIPQIVERRIGQVRFSFPRFTVIKGDKLEFDTTNKPLSTV